MSGNDEMIYVDQRIDRATVRAAAERVFTVSLEGVREASYPGYWAIDFGVIGVPLKRIMDVLERDLGVRPLTLAQVDSLFDPRTGALLIAAS